MFSVVKHGSWSTVGKQAMLAALSAALLLFVGVAAFAQTAGDPVLIDIKPGSDPNSINPDNQGKIAVAILSTDSFSAPDEVDCSTLTFGVTGSEDSLAYRGKPGQEVPQCGVGDVNGDGLLDLVCIFLTQETGFAPGDIEGILRGTTYGGVSFEGRDAVNIVP